MVGLKDGLYRLLNPGVDSGDNTIGYVAVAGEHLGTPVYLSLSQPNNLYEMVSFLLCHVLFICDVHVYTVGSEAGSRKPCKRLHDSEYWPISTTFVRDEPCKYLDCLPLITLSFGTRTPHIRIWS